jgi:hypothetical protein
MKASLIIPGSVSTYSRRFMAPIKMTKCEVPPTPTDPGKKNKKQIVDLLMCQSFHPLVLFGSFS